LICKRWILLFPLILLTGSCQKLPYVPDENAVLYIEASPAAIDGGESSQISIHGEKGSGYPLPDGTIVYLSASRGKLPSEAVLLDGRAAVEYLAEENFSGDVEIKARCGQSTVIPESLVITVADHEVESLMIWADPAELPFKGGQSVIDVAAYDAQQAPVAGKIVFLSASNGTLSGGGARTTDADGTIRAYLETAKEAVVTAAYKDLTSTVTIRIASQNLKPVAAFSHSPLEPRSGETVYFNAAASYDSDGRIVSYKWDFGDGSTGSGESVSHAYTVSADRSFVVVLKVMDDDGDEGVKTDEIEVLTKE
jgi:hypothetical protein